jgi:hypothetical protein
MRAAVLFVLLMVVVFAVNVRAPMNEVGGDSFWTVHESYNLVAHGRLDLDTYRPLIAQNPRLPHWTVGGAMCFQSTHGDRPWSRRHL